MKSNKKQKIVKSQKRSNTEYSQSLELTEYSNNESTETISDNEESKSDTSENLSQNSKSIPDGYRSLSKASASKLGSQVWNYFQPLEHIATGNRVEWYPLENAIKELVIILCPFAEASTYLGASKSSMIGFINPTLSYIKQDLYNENSLLYNSPNLEDLNTAFDDEINEENNNKLNINIPQDCDNLGKKVQATLYKTLETYWNSPVNDDLLPTLLDPHHKQLKFADSLDRKYVENTLRYKELSAKSLKKKFISTSQNDNNNEVENYLQLSEIDTESDVSIQAILTPSECLFSNAGIVMSTHRVNLNPLLFECMLFLKRNSTYLGNFWPTNE
ncbi:419_t:CDS:2 [Scutellospora calospora]|uniref:419_t:CDS:1 n=1 Tax=Scutellospora calospora TaxID=85575 RepID=A0ACA9KVW8_9GLOM|nr:419_t:CDS:2 [Scutellospora calospora]